MNTEIKNMNNGDPRLSLILKSYEQSDISILGFPFDLDNNKIPRGQEYGPGLIIKKTVCEGFCPKLDL